MAPEGVVLAGSTPAPGSESLTASAPRWPPDGAWSRGENMPLSATGCGGNGDPPGRPAREARPANASGATDLAGPSSRP